MTDNPTKNNMQGTSANREETVICHVETQDIDLFNKLFEGYDNMAMVTTVDAALGKLVIRFASAAKKDLLAVLHCMPIPVKIEGSLT